MFRNHWRNLPRNEPELERGGEGGELGRETPRPQAEVGSICTLHILRTLYSITLLCSYDTCVALESPTNHALFFISRSFAMTFTGSLSPVAFLIVSW